MMSFFQFVNAVAFRKDNICQLKYITCIQYTLILSVTFKTNVTPCGRAASSTWLVEKKKSNLKKS